MKDTTPRDPQEILKWMRDGYAQLQQQVEQVVVGQEHVIKLLTTGLMCGGHMLMIGVPGLAKTMMVKTLAQSLGWRFQRIQFTPDLMPSDITGTEILQADESGQRRELVFHRGPLFANLILADEINRTPPKTQAALLEAMQESAVTINGKTYPLDPPFVVVATQNPIEQEGTYPLPEAQLDRFLFSIHIDYPPRDQALDIAGRSPRMLIPPMSPVGRMDDFHLFTQAIDQVPVSRHVLGYAVDLTTASRPQDSIADGYVRDYVSWGVGPRGAQHLITAAKAWAVLDGRPSPEIADVRAMALPVLRHRIVPNYNALGEGIEACDIVRHLLEVVRESVAA